MKTAFALVLASLLSTNCCWAQELVVPIEVRVVVADGKHNAFTAFVRWRDAYWLAFGKAEAHNSGDGDLIVLRSADTGTWTEALCLDVLPDDRDPQFLATDKRLFLYDPALKGGKLTSFVTYTDDGEAWSEPKPVYKPTYIFWKPETRGDCSYPGVARDGDHLLVTYYSSHEGAANTYLARVPLPKPAS